MEDAVQMERSVAETVAHQKGGSVVVIITVLLERSAAMELVGVYVVRVAHQQELIVAATVSSAILIKSVVEIFVLRPEVPVVVRTPTVPHSLLSAVMTIAVVADMAVVMENVGLHAVMVIAVIPRILSAAMTIA